MATELPPERDNNRLFQDIDAYPWDSDTEFQGGLAAILGPNANSSPSQTHELTLRARLFYFARKKNISAVDFDAYKAHLASKSSAPTDAAPSYPTPFADIVALITSGQPIPGIKEIPAVVLSDRVTQPVASKRRKPWEKDESLALEQRTFGDRRDEAIAQDMHGEPTLKRLDGES